MSQYYFAVSSLPHLLYGMEKIPSVEEFLDVCESNLNPADLAFIRAAKLEDPGNSDTGSPVLNDFFVWERNLRNKLVLLRAKKKNINPDKYLRESGELSIDDRFVQEAFEHDSPLEAEDILDTERWSYFDRMELGHYFDEIKLLVYYLKLQLLWKRKSFNKEKGTEKFNQILEQFSSDNI